MVEYSRFRNQPEPRSPWSLNPDSRAGFTESVNNNQLQLALFYAKELFTEFDEFIDAITKEIAELKKNPSVKTTTPRTSTAKKAEVSDEE